MDGLERLRAGRGPCGPPAARTGPPVSGGRPGTDSGPAGAPAPPRPPRPAPGGGESNREPGGGCPPAGGRLRVSVAVRKPRGGSKARVSRVTFYTKGKG